MSGVVGDFVDTNANSRTLAPASVGSQVLLMSAVSLVTIIVFNLLRPRNKIVYEPKVKYHVGDKPPPKISDSAFGWLPPLLYVKEPELLDKVGLDAVAFLRFLRMLRWLFSCVAILACSALIPANVVYNLRNVNSKRRDVLSMLTLRDLEGSILFVHVAATYLFTFLVIGFVWYHWKKVLELRHTWFRSPEYIQSFYARTVMIRKVPKSKQSDEGIRSVLESVQIPYPATSVHIGRKVGRLPELIEYHNDVVRKLEQVLVRYLKGGKIGAKRPTLRKGGFWGMGGEKVDAIDFYTDKLKRSETSIEEYRQEIDHRKAENYGFASMAAVPYAHIVANMLKNKRPKGTVVTLAPNPKDIIWENISKSDATIARKRTIGWIWLVAYCFLNTIPLLAVSFLANLASLTAYVPFIDNWAKSSPASFAIISGVLPPAVSALFGWFLPVMMRWLSRYQGAMTRSRLDRAVVARYFAFLMISQLFIFTLIGVIFNSVREIVAQIGKGKSFEDIIHNFDKLPATINRTYIDQANFWLTFFPLRGFLAVFDLAQILNLLWIWFKTKIFGRTPRDIREWTQPPDFEYAIYYSNLLYMAAVGLLFAPLAPLVVVAAAVVFWISSFVYKYQLMFVFVSKVESGGRLWNVVINRLLVTVIFMQALMVLTIGLQEGWATFKWVSTIPPIFMIFAFKIYINRTFLPKFRWYIPNEDELRDAKIYSSRADRRGGSLEKRFDHPALNAELFTPMLHAKMMPLLPEVYHGRLKSEETKVEEYGGQKMEASVIPGGIRIAGIQQSELEYDPALYQRDRGELDWDQRSIASSSALDDMGGHSRQKSGGGIYAAGQNGSGHVAKKPSGYDAYLAHGTSHDIEMARMDGRQNDQYPLLADPSPMMHSNANGSGYFDPRFAAASNTTLVQTQYNGSQASLPGYREYSPMSHVPPPQQQQQFRTASPAPGYINRQGASTPQLGLGQHYSPVSAGSPSPQYPPGVYQQPYAAYSGEREATLHRPRQPSADASATLNDGAGGQWSRGPSPTNTGANGNFAGRGAGAGRYGQY